MPVSATVFSVDCPAAQRARFRACATPVQISSVEARGARVGVDRAAGERRAFGAHREIQADPALQVRVLTLLY